MADLQKELYLECLKRGDTNPIIIADLFRRGATLNWFDLPNRELMFNMGRVPMSVFKLFLENGTPFQYSAGEWKTCLPHQIIYGDMGSKGKIQMLEEVYKKYPGSVNATDTHGRTSLHIACYFGMMKTIQYLLEQGADPTIRDSYGYLARDLLRESKTSSFDDWIKKISLR